MERCRDEYVSEIFRNMKDNLTRGAWDDDNRWWKYPTLCQSCLRDLTPSHTATFYWCVLLLCSKCRLVLDRCISKEDKLWCSVADHLNSGLQMYKDLRASCSADDWNWRQTEKESLLFFFVMTLFYFLDDKSKHILVHCFFYYIFITSL